MTNCWTEPMRSLVGDARGWAGVWTLTYATGVALQRLAMVEGWDKDLTLTYASLDVALAASELEWADPTGTAQAPQVDLGPLVPPERRAAVAVAMQLLGSGLALLTTLLTDPAMPAGKVLSGTRAFGLLAGAERSLRAGST